MVNSEQIGFHQKRRVEAEEGPSSQAHFYILRQPPKWTFYLGLTHTFDSGAEMT